MRVGYVLNQFPVLSETFILREMEALQDAGVEIVVLALADGDRGPTHAGVERFTRSVIRASGSGWFARLAAMGGWIGRKPAFCLRLLARLLVQAMLEPAWGLRLVRRLPCIAVLARRAVDLGVESFHAHFAYLPADAARIMAGLAGLPFSVSAHAWDVYAQSRRSVRRSLHGAAFVATCFEQAARDIGSMCAAQPLPSIHVIHHGVVASHYRISSLDDPLILAIGRLIPKKGFTFLVEACARLRDGGVAFRCLLVGEGPCRVDIENAIAMNRLGGLVSLTGALSEEAVVRVLSQAGVLALPSVVTANGDRDGLPNVLLEAWAAGVPVVATTASAAPEVVMDGENGFLVSAGDAPALAARLGILLRDAELRRKLGAAGRARVVRDFDVARNTQKLKDLLAGCIGGRSRPSNGKGNGGG